MNIKKLAAEIIAQQLELSLPKSTVEKQFPKNELQSKLKDFGDGMKDLAYDEKDNTLSFTIENVWTWNGTGNDSLDGEDETINVWLEKEDNKYILNHSMDAYPMGEGSIDEVEIKNVDDIVGAINNLKSRYNQ